jgi:hypothetical protein
LKFSLGSFSATAVFSVTKNAVVTGLNMLSMIAEVVIAEYRPLLLTMCVDSKWRPIRGELVVEAAI